MRKQNKPLVKRGDVKKNPDKHIDQDFPGYPHSPSKEKQIKPQTEEQKLEAGSIDQQKKPYKSKSIHGSAVPRKNSKGNETDEQASDGSAGAFEGTETVSED
jgi:hypothetical protein